MFLIIRTIFLYQKYTKVQCFNNIICDDLISVLSLFLQVTGVKGLNSLMPPSLYIPNTLLLLWATGDIRQTNTKLSFHKANVKDVSTFVFSFLGKQFSWLYAYIMNSWIVSCCSRWNCGNFHCYVSIRCWSEVWLYFIKNTHKCMDRSLKNIRFFSLYL